MDNPRNVLNATAEGNIRLAALATVTQRNAHDRKSLNSARPSNVWKTVDWPQIVNYVTILRVSICNVPSWDRSPRRALKSKQGSWNELKELRDATSGRKFLETDRFTPLKRFELAGEAVRLISIATVRDPFVIDCFIEFLKWGLRLLNGWFL